MQYLRNGDQSRMKFRVTDDLSSIVETFPGYGDALFFDQQGNPKSAYAAVMDAPKIRAAAIEKRQ